jgi:hypothetical protein
MESVCGVFIPVNKAVSRAMPPKASSRNHSPKPKNAAAVESPAIASSNKTALNIDLVTFGDICKPRFLSKQPPPSRRWVWERLKVVCAAEAA